MCHALSQVVDAVVLPIDDFFNAHITDAEWDVRDAAARARDALDWRRLRIEALEPLRDGQVARWHAFDFAAGRRSDGSYAFHAAPSTCIPASIVLVDGAYSARPELRDLCDVRVLIELAAPVRESRLRSRESAEFLQAWHARWDAAEERYFTVTSPPSCFDLVVVTPGDAP